MKKTNNAEDVLGEIEEELKYILVIKNWQLEEEGKYKPIKNTSKNECYEAIYNIKEILRRYKTYEENK